MRQINFEEHGEAEVLSRANLIATFRDFGYDDGILHAMIDGSYSLIIHGDGQPISQLRRATALLFQDSHQQYAWVGNRADMEAIAGRII